MSLIYNNKHNNEELIYLLQAMEFNAFTDTHLKWIDNEFDKFQAQYFHKWEHLAVAFKNQFQITGIVTETTIRKKLKAYWVCCILYCYCIVLFVCLSYLRLEALWNARSYSSIYCGRLLQQAWPVPIYPA